MAPSTNADECDRIMDMIISIVIPTFRRNDLLARAVLSCVNQRDVRSIDYEVIVVDNCSDNGAKIVADEFKNAQVAVRYVSEPRRGVACARNTGVSMARGAYVAFLDDDECATPNWLSEFRSHASQGAVAVFGPIHERIDDSLKSKRGVFDFSIVGRNFDRCDGADISDCLYQLGTGNSLFSRRECFAEEAPFNERYNFGGGEDIEFLSRLLDRKVRFTWAANAWVDECVCEERLSTRYLMKRRFQAGQVRTVIESKNKRFGIVRAILWMTIGGVQVLVYSAGYLLARARGRDASNCAARIAGGAGKLLFFANRAGPQAEVSTRRR